MGMYKKLVRDKIPEKITQNGEIPETRILNEKEFLVEIKKKLLEEASECAAAINVTELTEELADLEEVILAILRVQGIAPQAVEDARQEKFKKRGGFEKQIYLEGIK